MSTRGIVTCHGGGGKGGGGGGGRRPVDRRVE